MKYTLEEIKEKTGWNNIISHRKIKEGYEEITDRYGNKKLYSKGFKKELTEWFVSRRKTKEGYEEITFSDGDKMLFSSGFKKQLTGWFKGDYIVEDGKIFVKKEIGEVE